ncbi:helix-turn-helix transcriptional regulator [Paenibacillus sp. MCAF20]
MKITVKAARVNCGMKSEDVAEYLGLSLKGYSRKENGHTRFYADEIARLSLLFKVPFENLCESGCHIMTQEERDFLLSEFKASMEGGVGDETSYLRNTVDERA